MTTTAPASVHAPTATHERRIRASQAATLFPPGRHGKPRRPATIGGYIARGKAVAGVVVRLEGGLNTDGSWWTTAEAVDRFFRRLTELRIGEVEAAVPPDEPRTRSDAAAEIDRLLAGARKRARRRK